LVDPAGQRVGRLEQGGVDADADSLDRVGLASHPLRPNPFAGMRCANRLRLAITGDERHPDQDGRHGDYHDCDAVDEEKLGNIHIGAPYLSTHRCRKPAATL